jgi:hypothetical protein
MGIFYANKWPPTHLIWSDPVNPCKSVGLFLSLSLLIPFVEDRASNSRGRFRRRLISLIFAGRNRIILIRRELPCKRVARAQAMYLQPIRQLPNQRNKFDCHGWKRALACANML